MIKLYNTLTHTTELFEPTNPSHVTMYVCGPTVYNTPHIGNARPCVVFDLLFRVLKSFFPKVTYASNITDIDDKIITRAQELNISCQELTAKTEKEYSSIMEKLNISTPTITPRATENIPAILKMIEQLLQKNHAYISDNHVLFHVPSFPKYGQLSHKKIDDLKSDVRIQTHYKKKHFGDFVLWKPAKEGEPSWPSPWGHGRPGWHIECSAMIDAHLGPTIDIHGGGIDLAFPHHENEIAQSTCYSRQPLARFFLHNGHVDNQGDKMSKSLGNTVYLQDLLKDHDAPVVRIALMSAHYRQPLHWSQDLLTQSANIWKKIKKHLPPQPLQNTDFTKTHPEFQNALTNDLNTPLALRSLLAHFDSQYIQQHCAFLGLPTFHKAHESLPKEETEALIQQRIDAKKDKNFSEADRIRAHLANNGVRLQDDSKGTSWTYDD